MPSSTSLLLPNYPVLTSLSSRINATKHLTTHHHLQVLVLRGYIKPLLYFTHIHIHIHIHMHMHMHMHMHIHIHIQIHNSGAGPYDTITTGPR